ncbi:MAG TPA: hypothetical protein VK206_02440 [Anaerolineales bacterium]|nr:hypothetical protein [Anaerolineales bacterium]HLO31843.1 hypothetical protein [Anaerolineales bacterium]
MQRVTFGKFLENTSVYERAPIPIDAGLRRGVWLSQMILCACMIIYWVLPEGNYLKNSPLFMWTSGWLSGTWDFTADYRLFLLFVCGLVVTITLGLIIPTKMYQAAEINLHIALFVPVILAVVNLGFVVVLLLPVMANLLVWFLCLILGIVVLAIFTGVLLRMLAR